MVPTVLREVCRVSVCILAFFPSSVFIRFCAPVGRGTSAARDLLRRGSRRVAVCVVYRVNVTAFVIFEKCSAPVSPKDRIANGTATFPHRIPTRFDGELL